MEISLENFRRICLLGEGSFGKAYLYCQKSQKQPPTYVVIKRLKPLKPNPTVHDVPREVQIMRLISHPNILSLKAVFFQEGWNIITDFGLPLKDALQCELKKSQLRALVTELIHAIAYLHEKLIIHRDLKLSNLYVGQSGQLLVGDYSVSRQVADNLTKNTTTRNSKAPQILYCGKYGLPADIWALGVCLGEMVLGKPLFSSENDFGLLFEMFKVVGHPVSISLYAQQNVWHQAKELPYYFEYDPVAGKSIATQLSGEDPDLIDLLEKMLQLNPDKRPQISQILIHPFLTKPISSEDSLSVKQKLCSIYSQTIEQITKTNF